MRSKLCVFVVVSFLAAWTEPAAGQYLYRKIVDLNTEIPGGVGNFTSVSAPQIYDGRVYFLGKGTNNQWGIYVKDGPSPSVVADKNTLVPGDTNTFVNFPQLPSADGSDIVFQGGGGTAGHGVYLRTDQGLGTIADGFDLAPGTSNKFGSFHGPSIRNGNVVFRSYVNSQGDGVYLKRLGGDIVTVADRSTINPTTDQPFAGFGGLQWLSSDGSSVIFTGGGSSGIYRSSGGGLLITADLNTDVPGSPGDKFLRVGGSKSAWYSGGHTVFSGESTSISGVYVHDGHSLARVVDTTMQNPYTGQTWRSFGSVSADANTIVFAAARPAPSNRADLYMYSNDGEMHRVIESGIRLHEGHAYYNQIWGQAVEDRTVVFSATEDLGIGGQPFGLYRADLVEAPSPQPRLEPRANVTAGKKNLVFITHGWKTNEESFQWVSDMKAAIEGQIASRPDAADWGVVTFDWTDESQTVLPWQALNRALELGETEGQYLSQQGYNHVHFIAQSAGSGLIEAAAIQIKGRSPSATVHTTFLDAYAPGSPFTSLYGRSADWADHYMNTGDLPATQATLPFAHNVEVTDLNPDSFVLPQEGHAWPREFYLNSISASPPTEYEGYGFALSLEGTSGAWNPSSAYHLGSPRIILGDTLGEPEPMPTIRVDSPLDFASTPRVTSETGTVEFLDNQLTMHTGSPVWVVSALDTSAPVNFLTFDVEFISEAGAEGLLLTYVDDQFVGQIDERYALSGTRTVTFGLIELEPGYHTLAFRLDPFTSTTSSVVVGNVMTGFVVPEPSTTSLVVVGVFAMFAYAFLRRRHVIRQDNERQRCIEQAIT